MTEPIFTTPGRYMAFPGMAVLHRILLRTVRDGDCWIWQGAVTTSGYGSVKVAGKSQKHIV